MTMSMKDLGIVQVMLQKLNEQRLPHALDMKKRVDKGELLTDYDQEFLQEVAEEVRFIPALLERLPQFKSLAAQVFALFEHITAKGLENEKASAEEALTRRCFASQAHSASTWRAAARCCSRRRVAVRSTRGEKADFDAPSSMPRSSSRHAVLNALSGSSSASSFAAIMTVRSSSAVILGFPYVSRICRQHFSPSALPPCSQRGECG